MACVCARHTYVQQTKGIHQMATKRTKQHMVVCVSIYSLKPSHVAYVFAEKFFIQINSKWIFTLHFSSSKWYFCLLL